MSIPENISVKICGMRDADNITAVASLGPDYMGFIFYPESPRYVGEGFTLRSGVSPLVKRVGVFVNALQRTILDHAKTTSFQIVQLHGSEPVSDCLELRSAGLQVIKVFSVDDHFDFKDTLPYKKAVDFFLFDTRGKFYGGNAKAFNWDMLTKYDQEVPFFLSGGLTPENMERVEDLRGMNLHALDFNSGLEESPGMKDPIKVASALRIRRRWRETL